MWIFKVNDILELVLFHQNNSPSPPNTYSFPYKRSPSGMCVCPSSALPKRTAPFLEIKLSRKSNAGRSVSRLLSLGKKKNTLQISCETSYLLHHIVHEKYRTAPCNSLVFRCENKIASCVPSNNHDSSYRADTEAQILCLQTVPETHYWGNYFCALRLTPGCRVNPRWVNCLLTGDGAGPEIFFFFFSLPTVKMLLIGKQKPEIELTVGLLRLGQGHKSLTEVNRR